MSNQNIPTVVEKLIQLALKNPNKEEAASAALKAVELIDRFSLPVGDRVIATEPVGPTPNWVPPDPKFYETVDDILGKKQVNPDADPRTMPGLMIQDTELVDPQEAWRQRMVDAWKEIRAQRRDIAAIYYRLKQHFPSYMVDEL